MPSSLTRAVRWINWRASPAGSHLICAETTAYDDKNSCIHAPSADRRPVQQRAKLAMIKTATVTIFLLLLMAGTSEPAIYSCTVNGKTIYSDRPCSTNSEDMSVMKLADKPISQTRADDEPSTVQERRDLIKLRFNYEILDSEIFIKEKEIDKTIASMTVMKQEYDQKVDRLNNELKRYNRSKSYGKLQEQRILAESRSLQMELRNNNFIARDKIKALRAELTLLKQKKHDLEKRIQELNRDNK